MNTETDLIPPDALADILARVIIAVRASTTALDVLAHADVDVAFLDIVGADADGDQLILLTREGNRYTLTVKIGS